LDRKGGVKCHCPAFSIEKAGWEGASSRVIPEPEDLLQGNFSGFARTKPEKEGKGNQGAAPPFLLKGRGFLF